MVAGVLDGDRFYRQWSRWNYGEESAYFIVLDGQQIKYFNKDRQLVDTAFIHLVSAMVNESSRGLRLLPGQLEDSGARLVHNGDPIWTYVAILFDGNVPVNQAWGA